jgi:hypothetical protein
MKPKLREAVLFPLLAVLISVFFFMIVLEVTLRLIGVTSPVIHADMFRVHSGNPLLPYSLRPNYSGSYAGGAITVGEDGNRIVPLLGDAPEHFERDLIIVGDSVAFGQGLDDDETIAANLQRLLLLDGATTRVHLLGAPGYTSWNELIILQQSGYLQEARHIILIYFLNDITKDNDHFKFGIHGMNVYYIGKTFWHQLTKFLYEYSRIATLLADSIKRVSFLLSSRKAPLGGAKLQLNSEALDYSMDAILKIKQMCQGKNIDFVVAIYRPPFYYNAQDKYLEIEQAILESRSQNQVRHFVLNRATNVLSQGEYRGNWNDADHPSAEAARIIASQIMEEISLK